MTATRYAACKARLNAYYARRIGQKASACLYLASRRGRSSGVERNLAKVEVVSSNLIARSIFFDGHPEKTGAGDGIRTHDFNLGKVALYP